MTTARSILVVDDELLIRDLLYDFFTSQGWTVSIADGGEKALEVVKNRAIDLLLTDIRMPDMDGLTLAAKARDLKPSLPVLIMTGFPSVDSAVTALRLRLADYIVKPFNINQLYRTVEDAVKQSRQSALGGAAV